MSRAVIVACLLAACPVPRAGAGNIVMTVQVGNGPVVDLATFGGIGTGGGYAVSDVAIAALNAYLAGAGSEYRFAGSGPGATVLGGASNNPGGPAGGLLTLSGTVFSVGAGVGSLALTETEAGFLAPAGPAGFLDSSSTGNFAGEAAGAGHLAESGYNAIDTGLYAVLSPGGVKGAADASAIGLFPVSEPYTLTDEIIFGLTPGTAADPIVDGFSVTGVVEAVYEPGGAALLSIGVMLAGVYCIRRRG